MISLTRQWYIWNNNFDGDKLTITFIGWNNLWKLHTFHKWKILAVTSKIIEDFESHAMYIKWEVNIFKFCLLSSIFLYNAMQVFRSVSVVQWSNLDFIVLHDFLTCF